MSNNWRQYGGINNLDNSRYGKIIADEIILKNGYNGDLNINGNLNVGNIIGYSLITNNLSINNDITISGNITTNNNAIFNGDVNLNGNTNINGTLIFNSGLSTKGNLDVGLNINIGNDASINGNIYLKNNYIIDDLSGIGINTSPIATLDISGNNIQSLNVFSNNDSTFNIIAQNKNYQGIITTANTISSSIQFYNDTSINNNILLPFTNNIADSEIKYTTGGNLDINASNNLTIGSKLSIIPDIQYNENIIKHTSLSETTIIYDTSSNVYLPSIYNNNTTNTGNALTLLASDTSSNTFLHIKSQYPYKGLSIGGGVYPLDETRSMGTIGYTDPLTNTYNNGQIIISGNTNIYNTITTGINTYEPTTERYALDINGETRIHSGDLRYTTPPFCVYSIGSYGGNVIAIGGYTINAVSPNKYHAYSSIDSGKNWNLYSLSNIGNIENTTNLFNYIFYYNATIAFIVGENGFKGYTNNNGKNWYTYTLSYNSSNLSYNATSFYAYQKDTYNTRCFISYNDNMNTNIPSFYFDVSTNALYNNTLPSIIDVTNNNIGNTIQINSLSANSTTLYLLSDNVNNQGIYYLYSTLLSSPLTINTLATYNSTNFIPNTLTCNINFIAIGGNNGIYSSQNSGTSFTFTTTNEINTFAIYSSNECVALGNNGIMYYTTNGGLNWNIISNDILNSSGTYGYLNNNPLNNINSATFSDANTLLFNGYLISNQENSNIYSLYAPNLFNANYNNSLDVSGSIRVSGSININDGGFLDSNNSSFNLLNSPTNNIYIGNNSSYLYLGNTKKNTTTIVNNNAQIIGNLLVAGNLSITGGTSITVDTSNSGITTYTNLTDSYGLNSGSVIIYGGSSIDGNLFIGNNFTTYNNSYIQNDLQVNGNSYINNSLNIGSTIPSNYNLNVIGNANISNGLIINGNVGIGKNIPLYQLDISGIVNANSLYVNGSPYIGSQWTTTGNNIYYTNGNVGIGTNTPLYQLDISGNLHVSNNILLNGNIGIGTNTPLYQLDVSGIVNANNLYVNGSPYIGSQWTTTGNNIYYTNGNVGIGINTPLYQLDISGNIHVTNSLLINGNIGNGIDLGYGDINRGNISNSGKIIYGPTNIDGNSLVIIGKGTNITNRNIDLYDNVLINGNITINNAINAYTTKNINGINYTGLVVQKTNPEDSTFNLSLIDISNSYSSKRTLGFNSYANTNSNNGITNAGDHQIIYTDDITSGGFTNCGLTIAPYDTKISGIRLDSQGFLGICKNSSTYSTPLDVGKSSNGLSGIQTRTLQGIDNNNLQQILHIIQPVTLVGSSPPSSNVGYNSIYNLTTNNLYDISAGLSIGWNSQTSTTINNGTSDFLNWANTYNGGFSFHTINSIKNYTPTILFYIDSSGNKTSINKYPNYTENTLYSTNLDVSGSGRFIQDCSSVILKCYNRSASQTTGTRLIFDTDGHVGSTLYSFPYTYISAIQDATNSATLNFGTNNQNRMTISYSGLIGIGTTIPTYNLDVTGNGRFTTDLYSGNIYSNGLITGTYYEQSNGTINLQCTAFPTQTYSTGMNNTGINTGLQIGWNGSNGQGETNLLNWAQGGSGGFSFNTISTNNSTLQLGTIFKGNTISTTLTNNGVLNMNGSINATNFYINGVSISNSSSQWTNSSPYGIYYSGNIYGNYVGILGTNTNYNFYVNGTIGCNSTITGGAFNSTSDYRIKENPEKIDINKYNLDKLEPIYYKNLKTNLFDFGLIAHEVQKIFPFLVSGKKDDEEFQTVNYIGLIPILIKELQEIKLQNKKNVKTNIIFGLLIFINYIIILIIYVIK